MPLVSRSIARAVLPGEQYDAMSFAMRRLHGRRRRENIHTALDRRFARDYGTTVQAGPFTGLVYDPRVIGHTTAVAAKLLGAYERELHPAIRRTLASDMSQFVDIGCAEGYYATGVAYRRRDVRVVAFDIDPAARHMCRLLAQANDVTVDIRCEATNAYLASLGPSSVVFSDCEGAEAQLLDMDQAGALGHVPIIVEIHDFVDPKLSPLIRTRFEATHKVDEIRTAPRDPAMYPELKVFAEGDRHLALSEGRPASMSWLIMEPR